MLRRLLPHGARRRTPVDRLTAADVAVLWPEDHGWPQDLGLLALLDGRDLVDGSGRFRIEVFRRQLADRLPLLPRFGKVMVRPRTLLGLPFWVDPRSIDITEHVRVLALEPPGGDDQLLRACEGLWGRRFDRTRPLWQFWFLTGRDDGAVGMLAKIHHSLVDGASGVAALGTFSDTTPTPPTVHDAVPAAPSPGTSPVPSVPDLLLDVLRRRATGLVRLTRTSLVRLMRLLPSRRLVRPQVSARLLRPQTTARLLRPQTTARLLRPQTTAELVRSEPGVRPVRAGDGAARGGVREWRLWRETFRAGLAPRTSLNRRIGPHRRLAIVRGDLARCKRIAHAHGATVNDVLLSAVAGGLRELLAGRGEQLDDLALRASVPVSLHPRAGGRAEGNLDAGMIVPLPVGEPDPVRRLRRVAEATAELKRTGLLPMGTTGVFRFPLVQRLATPLAARQRMSNVYVANVPGPREPLSLAGARLLELFPIVPIMGNIPLGVGALSYAGQFNITVVADRDACPDVGVFVAGLRRGLDEPAYAAR